MRPLSSGTTDKNKAVLKKKQDRKREENREKGLMQQKNAKSYKSCSPECINHSFSFKPTEGNKITSSSLEKQINFKLCPENNYMRPRIMMEFRKDPTIPLFGNICPESSRMLGQFKKLNQTDFENFKKIEVGQLSPNKKQLSPHIIAPRGKNCQACRELFEDYFNHIGTDKHRKIVRNSLGQRWIKQLEKQFQDEEQSKRNRIILMQREMQEVRNIYKFSKKILKNMLKKLNNHKTIRLND